jgi:hypothetical protein
VSEPVCVRLETVTGNVEAKDADGFFGAKFTVTILSPMSGLPPVVELTNECVTSGFGRGWFQTTLSGERADALTKQVAVWFDTLMNE